jgi:hypothetical protein
VDWPGLALRLGLVLVLGLAAAAALVFAWQRPLVGLSAAERAFAEFVRLAGLVGLAPRRVETPFEYGRRVGGAIPEAAGEISTITAAYVEERYARRSSPDEGGLLAAAWRRLRRALVVTGARRRLKRPGSGAGPGGA